MELQTSSMSSTPHRKDGRQAASSRPTRIAYTIRRGRLGSVLIAHTRRGICAVLIGDDRDELRRELVKRFSNATLDYAAFRPDGMAAQAFDAIERSELAAAPPPLDLVGTNFQRTVWRALQRIPRGCTVTYSELATRIGRPTAVRAVASACAANSIAVLVPCHRVLGSDGRLTGYRWGVERKRKLLEIEKKSPAAVDFADPRSTQR